MTTRVRSSINVAHDPLYNRVLFIIFFEKKNKKKKTMARYDTKR